MTAYYEDADVDIRHGDCVKIMAAMPAASVDAIVTDPPYGLGFMGKAWDALPPGREWADQCLRVLKPGGHVLAFGGTRTWHRLAVAVEDAGFELRDSIAWLYGSGFPKSLNVSKALGGSGSKQLRARDGREVGTVGTRMHGHNGAHGNPDDAPPADVTTPEALERAGWGTALKPAFEPIVVGRKPLDGTVAANVLRHGVGALNIDACRTESGDREAQTYTVNRLKPGATLNRDGGTWRDDSDTAEKFTGTTPAGRWPTNVALDNDQAAALDEQSGTSTSRKGKPRGSAAPGDGWGMTATGAEYDDRGGASRFFPTFKYQAKAPSRERPKVDGIAHPTVKPLDLMRWLVRLVTPPGGLVLEPFLGSGTTAEACRLEGFRCIGIENDRAYLPLVMARLGLLDEVPPWERGAA